MAPRQLRNFIVAIMGESGVSVEIIVIFRGRGKWGREGSVVRLRRVNERRYRSGVLPLYNRHMGNPTVRLWLNGHGFPEGHRGEDP